ncbi:hypothetical protein EK21DRAFT_67974 [Setomelanomma holmii]|uniref:C2H2-type domain-containing protein n=1 Tax=Setomelanomma holmii TaxID=210430 RepID=A0A9P4LLK1_9PLEO|nr:hypothetical protein EK21DRAFT_67974 [Setomelanomma holmii]
MSATNGPGISERRLVPIGSVYMTNRKKVFVFKCTERPCNRKTYTRMYDLRRHYDGAHASQGPKFWCPYEGCERSARGGGPSFPRKDKLKDHVRSMHNGGD